MRVLFAGSPAIAIPALEAVFALASGNDGFELAGLLTNPDSARGRHGKPEPTELGAAAERLSAVLVNTGKPPLAALKPEKLDAAAREQAGSLKPDLLVSFAYGRIFGPKFLALFPLGGINIHPSLLPKYRGPAPIPQTILDREAETGITIQRLALEMDCGDILAQERFSLSGLETTESLSAVMAQKAAALLPGVLKAIAEGRVQARAQDHAGAVYCSLIPKEAGLIDWNKSAFEIDAQIRAYDQWPLSWTFHAGQRLFILKACPVAQGSWEAGGAGQVLGIDKERGILVQTGEGLLAAGVLQYQAKKALGWRDFLNGARNFSGARLG